MTIRTITTSVAEADRIYNGDQLFVVRKDNEQVSKGDLLMFDVCKDGRSVMRSISKIVYEVTFVADCDRIPVNKGWKLVAFKRTN